MLRFKCLGSGSSGNATLVEAVEGHHTTRVLIDCGLRLRDLDLRLQQAGTSIQELNALYITHEHSDHIGCARSLLKRHPIPIWMSHGSWLSIQNTQWNSFANYVQTARDGIPIEIDNLQLMPFTVPHDAREPLQVTCSNGDRQLGLITDLGHVTSHVVQALQHCHAVMIETNHDPDMLERSHYPLFLKQRIGGDWGHLANAASADLLRRIAHPQLSCVVAAHLSERNNTPVLARDHLSRAFGCQAHEIEVATPETGTPWFTV
jgi:phosphoribosyl 1,2-cyclic phosphodiesterase